MLEPAKRAWDSVRFCAAAEPRIHPDAGLVSYTGSRGKVPMDQRRPDPGHVRSADGSVGPVWNEALSLVEVLELLGHAPHQGCPASRGLTTGVWWVRVARVVGSVTLLVVDLDSATADQLRTMRALNRCTRTDRIRVLPRRHDLNPTRANTVTEQPSGRRRGAGPDGGG
jgi:hypothetical protein